MRKTKQIYISNQEYNLILFMRGMKYGKLEIELRDGEPYKLETAVKSVMIDSLEPNWDRVFKSKSCD